MRATLPLIPALLAPMSRAWGQASDEATIASNDYILVSTKDAGFEAGSFFTADLKSINHYIIGRPESFHTVETFPLPNGDMIRLYRVGSS